ncbi:MAG: DUF1924 domain-containing protein [Betaproteobacteria bacterium]|nr:DUF1924 domain-containing protein [Betaproteobacteria bacterium]
MKILIPLFLIAFSGAGLAGSAGVPALQVALAQQARSADPGFGGFSAERGASFYRNRHGGEWSCASCHTGDPSAVGRHAVTRKAIQPLAPAANAARFADAAKTEKWFRRNCNDVLKRACTAREKGDFIAFVSSVGTAEARP